MTIRKGHHMLALRAYVAEHPGCIAADAIRACGISQRQGYASLERAISGGLVRAVRELGPTLPPQGRLHLWAGKISEGEIRNQPTDHTDPG
jgi:hypothetical protein